MTHSPTLKTAQSIKLDLIKTDAGTQPRAILSDDVVAEYAERMTAGDKFPPVDVFHDGSEYILADGFHRFFGARHAEFRDILAIVHQGTALDALWFAIGCNKNNGLHRSKGDIRNAVVKALKQFPNKSQVEIANHVSCSQGLVSSVKADVITVITSPATRVDSKGRTQPTRKPHEPKATEPERTAHPTPKAVTIEDQWRNATGNAKAEEFPNAATDLEEARVRIMMDHLGAVEEGLPLITRPENLHRIRTAINHIDALARHGSHQTPAAA